MIAGDHWKRNANKHALALRNVFFMQIYAKHKMCLLMTVERERKVSFLNEQLNLYDIFSVSYSSHVEAMDMC